METRPISELKTNPLNPRGEVVVDDSLHELAASIRSHGVLQPILITSDGTIVAGHRRARACEIAYVKEIPVVVRELDESEQIQIMLIENLQRQSLTALQTAKAYNMLCEKGLSILQISMAIGYHKESIARHLNILKLPEELHSCFDGEYGIPLGGIRYLLELDEPLCLAFGLRCKKYGWSVGELKRKITLAKIKSGQSLPLVSIRRSILDRIWERVEDGCYTAETVMQCGECGGSVFRNLSREDVQAYLIRLVSDGRAEWRKQGGKKDDQRGEATRLCVPVGTPSGDLLNLRVAHSNYESDESDGEDAAA